MSDGRQKAVRGYEHNTVFMSEFQHYNPELWRENDAIKDGARKFKELIDMDIIRIALSGG